MKDKKLAKAEDIAKEIKEGRLREERYKKRTRRRNKIERDLLEQLGEENKNDSIREMTTVSNQMLKILSDLGLKPSKAEKDGDDGEILL